MAESYRTFPHVGLALDPIHVGTGGARLGRVDLTIVRDPVTRIPKLPGSSLAGVYRTYAAMARDRYPGCAGLGQPRSDGSGGHCGQTTCPICTVFGFARGRDSAGGFAGLGAFSDAHVLLFPVATREGPCWVTCPMALRGAGTEVSGVAEDALFRKQDSQQPLNLGWLLLPVKPLSDWQKVREALTGLGVSGEILQRLGVVPDELFGHVVNSNLEVRTSVAIDPATGAAEEGALFTYEALPRATVLFWEVTAKNPGHFTIGASPVAFNNAGQAVTIEDVHNVVAEAHPYLEHLGIGGMGTRGMGRLRVLAKQSPAPPAPQPGQSAGQPPTQTEVR
ncbi:MAG TPA: type III-B CRISPR module RAMP protein Cmr4 [Chloroflexota bacterium]|nr:type III-B CRISPR module RAMP protein Cmr4 [Chloroflexota bacterium]